MIDGRHPGRAGRPPEGPRDGVLAAASAAAGLLIAHAVPTHDATVCVHGHCANLFGGGGVGALQVALILLAAGALLGRGRSPRGVLGFIAVLTTIDAVLGQIAVALLPALAVAWVGVTRRGDRFASWGTIAIAVLVWFPLSFGVSHVAAPVAWLVVLAFGIEVVRTRRGRRVAQSRTLQETSLRRAEEERLRIARELHDVLAHNISLINIQSGVALHLLGEHPEQARPALSIINEASGDAMRELRSVLGVLRRVDEQAPRRPAAGLDHLTDLVATATAAGVHVRTEMRGRVRPLTTPVDLAAYRIVQESLTNIARHAAGGHAAVTVDYATDALVIEVADDGPAPGTASGDPDDSSGSGNGILGMRERATALGGTLQAGPRSDAPGFCVRARLPYGGGGA